MDSNEKDHIVVDGIITEEGAALAFSRYSPQNCPVHGTRAGGRAFVGSTNAYRDNWDAVFSQPIQFDKPGTIN